MTYFDSFFSRQDKNIALISEFKLKKKISIPSCSFSLLKTLKHIFIYKFEQGTS